MTTCNEVFPLALSLAARSFNFICCSSLFPDADFKNLWSGPADVIFNEVAFLVSVIYTECLRSYINAPIACQYNYYECGMRPLGD